MKRILVIDDDQASCNLLRELFAAQGWSAETAQTPDQAIALASSKTFDLVVSDINLEANQSGLDLLKCFRDLCPVILMTGFGYDPAHSIVRASQEGLAAVLFKPFKVEQLIGEVKKAVAGKSG